MKSQRPPFPVPQLLLSGVALLLYLVVPCASHAQQAANVTIDSNEQLFSVLAAMNAAGYDTGSDVDTGDNTRAEVRAYLARQNSAVVAALRKFYSDHKIAEDPGADLGQFVSLALLLGPPPDFKFTVAESDLPPDARQLRGLVPLLRTFYRQADLTDLWAQVEPRYQAQVERYGPAIRRSIEISDAYLRFPSGSYLGRLYSINLSLLGAPEQAQARIYGSNYYLVITPSREPKLPEIRHQYLHFLLDPLAVKYAPEIEQKRALAAIARKAPALETDFKEDFPLLVTECLIRAVELRLDKPAKPAAAVSALAAQGLILVPYFYAALQDYEKQESAMSVYYKQMIEGINTADESQRLASVKFIPAAPVQKIKVTPALTEIERLLNEADNLIAEGKYPEARADFETVLEKYDPRSERALFGLAVVASNTRKPDTATKYFKQTLDVARDLRIVTWSHIYLGRIYDLESMRTQALAQYKAASLTASAFPDALRAVQSGLAYPFGTK